MAAPTATPPSGYILISSEVYRFACLPSLARRDHLLLLPQHIGVAKGVAGATRGRTGRWQGW